MESPIVEAAKGWSANSEVERDLISNSLIAPASGDVTGQLPDNPVVNTGHTDGRGHQHLRAGSPVDIQR